MKKHEHYNLEDLLMNESFRQWALHKQDDGIPFWENWIEQNPDKKEVVEEALTIIRGLPFEFKEKTADPALIREEWKKLKRTTQSSSSRPINVLPKDRQRPPRPGTWLLRIAASLVLLAVLGFLLHHYVINPIVIYKTPYGRQLSIVLSDSTAIELNANSILTHRKWNPRKVWLDGEAFFNVKKKPATGANFRVITNDLTVEVLGTAFNVIEKKDKTEVILEEGSVKLNLNRNFDEELYMEPGELVGFSAQASQKLEKRQVETQPLTSWKDGVLEFEDVMLSELMDRIEVIYGWRAVYHEEAFKSRKISIGLPSDDLEIALVMLSKAIGIEIDQVKENKVLLLH